MQLLIKKGANIKLKGDISIAFLDLSTYYYWLVDRESENHACH